MNLVDEIVKIVSQPQVLLNLETHKVIFYFLFVHLSILSILSNVYKQLNNDLQIFHWLWDFCHNAKIYLKCSAVTYCSMTLKQMKDFKFHNTSWRHDFKKELWKLWRITANNTTGRGSFLYSLLMFTKSGRKRGMPALIICLPSIG